MDSMRSDHTRGCVVAGVLHNVWLKLPHQGVVIKRGTGNEEMGNRKYGNELEMVVV